MDFFEIIKTTLSSDDLWGAILSTILIIYLGYLLVKIKFLKLEWRGVISKIVLNVALPALVLQGFMTKISINSLKEQCFILVFGFVFYIFLIFISKYIFFWMNEKKRQVKDKKISNKENKESSDKSLMRMMWVFGSTGFFGLPIIEAVYGIDSIITAVVLAIGMQVFLYSTAYQKVAQIKITRKNFKDPIITLLKTPAFVAVLIGFSLWTFQLATPEFSYKGSEPTTFFDLSVTAPYVYKMVLYLAGLVSPLIWITIGMTLADANIKEIFKDKRAWIYVLSKQILLPCIALSVLLPFATIESLNLTATSVSVIVVLFAVPPASVVVGYAIRYKKSEELGARCSILSTIAAIIAMPFWIVFLDVVTQLVL